MVRKEELTPSTGLNLCSAVIPFHLCSFHPAILVNKYQFTGWCVLMISATWGTIVVPMSAQSVCSTSNLDLNEMEETWSFWNDWLFRQPLDPMWVKAAWIVSHPKLAQQLFQTFFFLVSQPLPAPPPHCHYQWWWWRISSQWPFGPSFPPLPLLCK